MTLEVIKELINQRVVEALAAQEANCNVGPIVGSENQYGDEEGDSNGEKYGNGNGRGNGNSNGGGNGNNGNGNCNGMKGVGMRELRVCALTWWNSHVETVGIDGAYEMSWKDLMKLMIEVYCPRNEIQKLENELWNLSVKGIDVTGYTTISRIVIHVSKNGPRPRGGKTD
ncbi:reverse transcriptase domain-containing protein [Tanacetum coccineum]